MGEGRHQYYFTFSKGVQSAAQFGNLCSEGASAVPFPSVLPGEPQAGFRGGNWILALPPYKPSRSPDFMGDEPQTRVVATGLAHPLILGCSSFSHNAPYSLFSVPPIHLTPISEASNFLELSLLGRQACSLFTSSNSPLLTPYHLSLPLLCSPIAPGTFP